MATYTSCARIKEAYKTCRGRYMGMGPVGIKPKRFKIAAFWSKRKGKNRLYMMLTVVA
jgi:hypothetical protein